MELSLQMQQKQILSQKMQQSVEILQMNAVTLSEYIREFAEENPLVEWNEERSPCSRKIRSCCKSWNGLRRRMSRTAAFTAWSMSRRKRNAKRMPSAEKRGRVCANFSFFR